MYEIVLINDDEETIIHYPDPEAPKVAGPKLTLKRSRCGSLTFTVYQNNPGYNLLSRITTQVKAKNTQTGEYVFTGRVYSVIEEMDTNGLMAKEVVCEGAMNYLNDTMVTNSTYSGTAKSIITTLLNAHNEVVEDYKKVYVGNIDVNDTLEFTTDFETTLEAIQSYIYNENKGTLQFRAEDGKNYLDYISTVDSTTVNVNLGENLESLSIDDSSSFGTRIIPVGANGLTIESVNGGKNYLEDTSAVEKYGVIYKKADYTDIEDAYELMTECEADLSQYTQPAGTVTMSALDLSTLADTDVESIDINTIVHITCTPMGVDDDYKVTQVEADLSEPWNPTITLSNKSTTLESTLNSTQENNVTTTSNYNGVQITNSGLKVVNDAVTVALNATDGIKIENSNKTVFSVDDDGNVVANDGTYNDITANNMTANEMKSSNTSNYIILHDQYIEFYHEGTLRMRLGHTPDSVNFPKIEFYAESGLGSEASAVLSATGSGDLLLNGKEIVTK